MTVCKFCDYDSHNQQYSPAFVDGMCNNCWGVKSHMGKAEVDAKILSEFGEEYIRALIGLLKDGLPLKCEHGDHCKTYYTCGNDRSACGLDSLRMHTYALQA